MNSYIESHDDAYLMFVVNNVTFIIDNHIDSHRGGFRISS